jgi:hypothetical protein
MFVQNSSLHATILPIYVQSKQHWLGQNWSYAKGSKNRGTKSQLSETQGAKSAILKYRGSKSQLSET